MAEGGHEAKRAPDLGSYGGLFLGFFALGFGFWLEGGDFSALLLPSPIIIIFGGTAATLWMCIPGQNPLTWGGFFAAGFTDVHHDAVATIQTFVRLAEKARREGLLSLESEMGNIHDAFMKEGVQEVVDGTPAEQITDIFMVRIDQMGKRHHVGKEFYGQGGAFAPCMGIIGTVLGLTIVLGSLGGADAAALGHSIATAFIATLFGVALANLLLLPIGKRCQIKSEHEVEYMNMLVAGILSIQAGDSPRLVRAKLNSYLPPAEQKRLAKAAEGGAAATAAA
ncbi:MAG: MotA/TolQ/ExbB proton channel family protein [Chloroflexi bacterium]|nr:MotA/TolQ/ExbB proton channel family protein [Chloroflexota bacterium]